MLKLFARPMQTIVKQTPQYKSVQRLLSEIDVNETLNTPQNRAPRGLRTIEERSEDEYSVSHVVEDGIERITYTPDDPKYETPILMMHGMFHGAWCWSHWQALFAGWGWQSVAFSLPGHGESAPQKPTTQITLDYYLAFLRDEIARLDHPPVLMGHSMGGALSQWYLRYVDDDLPAVVLIASWVHDSAQREGFATFFSLDPMGLIRVSQTGDATPFIRSAKHATRLFISNVCIYTPEDFYKRLSPESNLILFQHDSPHWEPAGTVRAPMIYFAGERDAVISVEAGRQTATHYNADFVVVPDAPHNLMMDVHYQETARQIHDWLGKQKIK